MYSSGERALMCSTVRLIYISAVQSGIYHTRPIYMRGSPRIPWKTGSQYVQYSALDIYMCSTARNFTCQTNMYKRVTTDFLEEVPESCGQKACVKSPVTSVDMRERERERTK